jgi:hypothetical protein
VVNAIVQDPTASAKHRLDGARELRACAGGEAENKPNERERYIINISFGKHKINKTVDLKPIKIEDDELIEATREPMTIEQEREYRPTGLLNLRR